MRILRHPALLILAAIAAYLAYLTSKPGLRHETGVVSAIASVRGIQERTADVWFWINGNSARYAIRRPGEDVIEALRASESSGNAVTLRVHLEGARFADLSDSPEYWVQSVEYLGRRYGEFEPRIRWSWRNLGPGDAGLLRGFALGEATRHDEAVKAFDSAIGSNSLRGKRLALAHLYRGDALDSQAYPSAGPINERGDRYLVRAIDDFRRASALDTSDHRPLLWEANASRTLGAYDEALSLYGEIERRWPDQYFRATIARSATYRLMGRPDEALDELDRMVKKHGSQDGMMYHYHRGWTLNALQRYAEAAEEFSAGIASQPDFAWAFMKRACAFAQMGEKPRAIADVKTAIDILGRRLDDPDASNAIAQQRARLDEVLRNLEDARQPARAALDATCSEGFVGPDFQRRERSELFKPSELAEASDG
jgi:tetratricopeptide (TPR) repeat protein